MSTVIGHLVGSYGGSRLKIRIGVKSRFQAAKLTFCLNAVETDHRPYNEIL